MPDAFDRACILCMGTMLLTLILLIPVATFIAVKFNTGPAILWAEIIPPAVGITVGLVYLRNAPPD